jgi:hypothetical protein
MYNATFEAVVEGSTDPKIKSFVCEVRGEGTLPSLTLQVFPYFSYYNPCSHSLGQFLAVMCMQAAQTLARQELNFRGFAFSIVANVYRFCGSHLKHKCLLYDLLAFLITGQARLLGSDCEKEWDQLGCASLRWHW